MLLKPPFIIGSTLSPALKIGDSTLHLTAVQVAEDGRDRATFLLVTPEFEYEDDKLKSGAMGFWGVVGIFESFLSFMQAAIESADYEERTGRIGDNTGLFPRHIVEWAMDHRYEIEDTLADITDEYGEPNESLIEE